MLADFIVEQCTTTGTSNPYSLGVGVLSGYQAWSAAGIASGSVVVYVAKTLASSPNGMKYEEGYGALTTGSPWTIARTGIIKSSNSNAAVDWLSSDIYCVYSAPVASALGQLMIGNMATSKPAWAQAGFEWLDSTAGIGTRLVRKLYNGSADVETGRYEGVPAIYVPSPRLYFRDTGTSGATVAATDIGNCIDCDVTAANRAVTLPAGATLGHGFSVWVYGYGSTSNSVVLTPDAGDGINEGADGVTKSILGGVLTRVIWDGAKSAWRTGA